MNRLGKYEIRRTLGRGAMGIVYEGFDPVIERTVAIKTVLPAHMASAEVVALMARFKREAQAAGRLNHPHIVAIYDYGEELAQDIDEEEATRLAAPPSSSQRVAFIAMEFVKGRELKDYLDKGERFPLPEVVRIMGEMLGALDHAHSHGVVHRDMKPANLILLADGHVKVADFGIARIEASELTQAGTIMGTPTYMSPEQFMGHTVDGRSDLFSCGVILYQLLTGEKPFTGESSTTIMYKVLREEPVPVSELNLAITPELEAVVKKALAKAPAQRFQTGKEFAAALQQAASSSTLGWAAAPVAAVASSTPAFNAPSSPDISIHLAKTPEPCAAVTLPPPVVAPRQGAMGAWVLGAVAVVALGAGGYLLLGPGRHAGSGDVAQAPAASGGGAGATPAASAVAEPAAAPAAAPVAAAPAAAAAEPGTMVISALGLADPQDARFSGNIAAAQDESRNAAKRQLVEKALSLYVDKASLESNYGVIEQKLLSNPGSFIRTVLQEGAPVAGKGGLIETDARAVVNVRDVQKSLNELSRQERIDFIRNKGDPKISIQINVGSAESATPFPKERSELAENVLKDRIKSFGFRVWSPEADKVPGPAARQADFAIRGEAKVKQLSMKLPASGLTITKTALTSWTIKAIDVATGEEVYLSTKLPVAKSWASEDAALAEIGQLVGDEFSRNFFLQHFSFRTQRTTLSFTGMPEAATRLMQRELRGMRPVLDAQQLSGSNFQLELPEGNVADLIQEAIIRPLNAKLGQTCLSLAGSNETSVTVAFAPACATPEVQARLENGPPAGWVRTIGAPGKGKPATARSTT